MLFVEQVLITKKNLYRNYDIYTWGRPYAIHLYLFNDESKYLLTYRKI